MVLATYGNRKKNKNAENLKDFLLKSAGILKETRFIYAQNLNAYHSSSLYS